MEILICSTPRRPKRTEKGSIVRVRPGTTIPIVVFALLCCRQLSAQPSYSPEYEKSEAGGFAGASFGSDFRFPTLVSGSASEGSRTIGMHYASGYQVGVRGSESIRDSWA